MEIIILNKIEDKINEYQERTGATKTWVAKQLGMTRQQLHALCQSDNMTLRNLIKVSVFFGCEPSELYEYGVVRNKPL